MIDSCLIAYATRSGSTQDIAEEMANIVRQNGAQVDVKPVRDVKSLDGYDAVILGTAIHIGHPLPEMTHFVRHYRQPLSAIPTVLYAVCMTMSQDTPENRTRALSFLTPITDWITPVSIGLFGGVMDYDKLNVFFRWAFSRSKDKSMAEGDFRDWDAIRIWADAATRTLTSHSAG
jgi:menaquinone-dependent protoporphyrinogen oxidase